PLPPGDSERDDARDEHVGHRGQPDPPAPPDASRKWRRSAGRAALPPPVPRDVGATDRALDRERRAVRPNGARHERYPIPWLWSHCSATAAALAPSGPARPSSSKSVSELSPAETASITRARAGPYRSRTTRLTTGTTFSAGCRPR